MGSQRIPEPVPDTDPWSLVASLVAEDGFCQVQCICNPSSIQMCFVLQSLLPGSTRVQSGSNPDLLRLTMMFARFNPGSIQIPYVLECVLLGLIDIQSRLKPDPHYEPCCPPWRLRSSKTGPVLPRRFFVAFIAYKNNHLRTAAPEPDVLAPASL